MEQQILEAAKEKIRWTPDVDIQIMYIWLEGYLAGIGRDDTDSFLKGSKVLRSLFN